jgi:hypothetical protein
LLLFSKSPFLSLGDHTVGSPACWRCWATFLMSPCPLQAIEIEGSVTISLAMFNLVEALPVMPGPCQLMHWQKMKQYHVVDEYFNLLFESEPDKTTNLSPVDLPPSLRQMKRPLSMHASCLDAVDGATSASNNSSLSSIEEGKEQRMVPVALNETMSFVEFLRTNMRLAEDRILTFVSVFSTGFGTKWVLGGTFCFQPEVQWNTLLTQRRRWTNGTFAGFLFCFISQRARSRILGGMFDRHKFGKNVRAVYFLWSLQIVVLCLLFLSPAVFGATFYVALDLLGSNWADYFGWALTPLFGIVRVVEVIPVLYLMVYAGWTLYSFFAPRGKIPEIVCQTLAFACMWLSAPIYALIFRTVQLEGANIVACIVISVIVAPILISLADDLKSAFLYLIYLPWLLAFGMFFIVFFPAYSFARLWDTTWGNRAGGKDHAMNDNIERYIKSRNFGFVLCIISLNIFLLWACVQVFSAGNVAILSFMAVALLPVFIQLLCSFCFLFIVLPIRELCFPKQPKIEKPSPEEDDAMLDDNERCFKELQKQEAEEDKRLSIMPRLASPSQEIEEFLPVNKLDVIIDSVAFPRMSRA